MALCHSSDLLVQFSNLQLPNLGHRHSVGLMLVMRRHAGSKSATFISFVSKGDAVLSSKQKWTIKASSLKCAVPVRVKRSTVERPSVFCSDRSLVNCTQLIRLITLHETTGWESQQKFSASHGCVIYLEETSDLIKHEFSKLIIRF